MIGLPIGETTRAAALDGALSFSVLLQNQRELTLGTAQSSVTGLLSAIQSAPADYARLLTTAQQTMDTQTQAASRLYQPAWNTAPDATRNAIGAALSGAVAAANQANTPIPAALTAAASETPTTFQLTTSAPPETYLTVWGDSGIVSLTDANGQGILISPDGQVDTVPPSGDGWQFKSDSTFLLPDGTKISVSPGSPATLLATRGQQRIEISNLQSGQTPAVQRHTGGGLAADAARNDGHVFVMGADQRTWTLSGSTLGDVDGGREVVATNPITHEQPVDVTNVALPADLVAQLQAIGIDATTFDANNDGVFSSAELRKLVATLDAAIGGAQERFDAALRNTNTALESLLRLNQFIEKILAESDRRQASRQQVVAEERDQLVQIQREIDAARNALRHAEAQNSTAPAESTTPPPAPVVLNQPPETGTAALREDTSPSTSPSPEASARPTPDTAPTSLAQSLRRAERLLSGFGNIALNPRFAEQAVTNGNNAPNSLPPVDPLEAQPAPTPIPGFSFTPKANNTSPNSVALGDPSLAQPSLPPDTVASRPTASFASSSRPTFPVPTAPVSDSPPHSEVTSLPPASIPEPQPLATSASIGFTSETETTLPATNPPRPPTGQSPLPGTRFPATGPDLNVAPDPTFGASDGFMRESRRRLDGHLDVHRDHIMRAHQLQSTARQVVERFVTLIGHDEQLRQVFNADDLSDAQRHAFKNKVAELERELGLAWGGDVSPTPQGETNLNARVLASGMMI